MTTVHLHVPDMHCASCVSFLERMPSRLNGVEAAQVDFPRKRLTVVFDDAATNLTDVQSFLAASGFPADVPREVDSVSGKIDRTLLARLAVAGFAFGNTMLLALAHYIGGDSFLDSGLEQAFAVYTVVLAIPVLFFSGAGYFRSAWGALRGGGLTMDVPVALGMLTLAARSTWEVVHGMGLGYFDSLAGLVFFLLIGKWYQARTHAGLAYERDYTSFFPLRVARIRPDGSAEAVPISSIVAGDRIRVHHGEIIPADALLSSGKGLLDRSFVTGESVPVEVLPGTEVEAGGRQLGGAIELVARTPANQSRLTRLWNAEAFEKDREKGLQGPVEAISRHFTAAVLVVGIGAFAWWYPTDAGLAWNALTATWIVACPCALALSLPFTYGSALRYLGRKGAYLKNSMVVERMARVQECVFDKTGTLTPAAGFTCTFVPLDASGLTPERRTRVAGVAAQSAHPLSRAILRSLETPPAPTLSDFRETPGHGTEATVDGHRIRLGSAAFLNFDPSGNRLPDSAGTTWVFASEDGIPFGAFGLAKPLREGIVPELRSLANSCTLHLVSGDQDADRAAFSEVFPADRMHFNQRPEDKMAFIAELQAQPNHPAVAMIGDGLNDAGALRAADLGVAVVDDLYAFSPASDVILDARALPQFSSMLRFARSARHTVIILFVISFLYNVVGLTFAVQGALTPLVAAVLMPISSLTVVGVALGRTAWAART